MKSVMISIRPKWCELIASGKKTVEVRKTVPKIETPFKCYIYQTVNGRINSVDVLENNLGKVIGEFVCDFIELITFSKSKKDWSLKIMCQKCSLKRLYLLCKKLLIIQKESLSTVGTSPTSKFTLNQEN